ncbi:MAG: CDP-glucose 4,6-dehydratase [Mariprofundaceae bacterium]|nr:CDP-glucose 4,6-dehydratase [Mariprofundaceae bacterium]
MEIMAMNPNFWKGKKVLLTGHTGFKGSWLSLWLQRVGADLTGYALSPPTTPSLFEAASVATDMRSIIGDIRDLEKMKCVIQEVQPEIVFHLAAQALVRPSYENPVETYSSNVMGTVNVLEAIRLSTCVKSAVIITSDKCYENQEWAWGYRETEPMGGYDPYSNSKGCSELIVSAYRQSFFTNDSCQTNIATARAGNVIGGGDWALDRLIPDMIRSFEEERPVEIRNPNAIRPWQHVLEPLSGYLRLAEKLYEEKAFSEGWNFGPNDADAKPVSWIVNTLTKKWGNGATWTHDSGVQPHEAHHLKLDCSKAKYKLQWEPTLDLETALCWIVEWHRSQAQGSNMKEITMKQIIRFMAKGKDNE